MNIFNLALDSILSYDLKSQDRRYGSAQLTIHTGGGAFHDLLSQIMTWLGKVSLHFATEEIRRESKTSDVSDFIEDTKKL